MTKKRALVATTVLIALIAVAAALTRGGDGGSSDARFGTASGSGADGSDVGNDASGGSVAGSTALKARSSDSLARESTSTATAPLGRAVISTGQVVLHAKDLVKARTEAIRLVTSWGGVVADEQSSSDDHGRLADSTLTVRIPSGHFAEAMNAFGALGEVEQRSQKSEDVTTKVIDNDARVRAAERSIRSIEALLSRAQRLGDVIAIESDLARRQADLDSLKSQQAWLADQTSLSTITVYLSRPVVHAGSSEARGFLGGLERGWHALGATTLAALTVLGAVLPFLVLLVLLGLPLWWVVRRRRPTRVVEA